jgi:hypothetical protein
MAVLLENGWRVLARRVDRADMRLFDWLDKMDNSK